MILQKIKVWWNYCLYLAWICIKQQGYDKGFLLTFSKTSVIYNVSFLPHFQFCYITLFFLCRFIMFLIIHLVSTMHWPTSWKKVLYWYLIGMSVCNKLLSLLLRASLVNYSCIIISHLDGYVAELLRFWSCHSLLSL